MKNGIGARFATRDEYFAGLVENNLEEKIFNGCGIPIWSDEKRMYMDDGENHALTIGSTGIGKSTSVAIPSIISILQREESIIVSDLKGEIYQATSAMANALGYKIVVLNFDRPYRSHRWNPLSDPYRLFISASEEDKDEAAKLVYDLSYSICTEQETDDPFWTNSSTSYTAGLILAMFEDAMEHEIHMRSVAYMSNVGQERV